ncbi:MAG: polysaccharide biosynthesis/export family protein [Flammeovirgaceae bacterium]
MSKKALAWTIFFVILAHLYSCVPNKKVVLLQKGDVNELPAGTRDGVVARGYALDTFRYKIQPHDIVSIRFESLGPKEFDFLATNPQAQLAGGGGALLQLVGEIVDQEGYVPVPSVGKFKIGGLTVFEAQEKLRAIAESRGLISPVVRVRLLNYRVTILGEVRHEGTFLPGSNRATMLEAISMAGGFTELADRSRVKLIRQVGDSTKVSYINLLQEGFFESRHYYAHQNDVLVVPALRQRPFRNYFGQNLSLFISTVSVVLLTLNLLKN